jgi:hypothetical protein
MPAAKGSARTPLGPIKKEFPLTTMGALAPRSVGKMFGGDSADNCGGKFPLMSMGG